MLMVENFTNEEPVAYGKEVLREAISEQEFEKGLKANLQKLMKSPSQESIDLILAYSHTQRKVQ